MRVAFEHGDALLHVGLVEEMAGHFDVGGVFVEGGDVPAFRQGARHPDGRIPGERADLNDAFRAVQTDQQLQKPPFLRADMDGHVELVQHGVDAFE